MAQHYVFQLTSGKGCSIMEMIIICQHQTETLLTSYFFLLLVTPDIPPVSGSNDAIKRLSSVRYFPKRSYRKRLVYVLMRNFLSDTY